MATTARFTPERLVEAFTLLGQDLAGRGAFIEIAVYGGSALMMQFDWRRSTEDVDALVREGFDEAILAPSVHRVAERMGWVPDWLNDAVGMFTPQSETEALFLLAGTYPPGEQAGLRVVVATPTYLLALKLHALSALDRGQRDMDDARRLAAHLGLASEGDLLDLYRSVYDDEPTATARARFAAVLEP